MLTTLLAAFIFVGSFEQGSTDCSVASHTTASGAGAPSGKICSGDLIFEENFNRINTNIWGYSNTLSGNGNGEFEWYTSGSKNAYIEDGKLVIKPTLVSDDSGEHFLYSGTINITDVCTDKRNNGCLRTGTATKILNPVKSAKLSSKFRFKYGKIEVLAKLPAGDWLWPAIWLMPQGYHYGGWPRSGEIDIMESRGNRNLVNSGGKNVGNQLAAGTVIWGPTNKYKALQGTLSVSRGFNADYHRFQLEWTTEKLVFSIDDTVIQSVVPPAGGFWKLGGFSGDNPWSGGTKMAPFDQEFYIILNTAVGGTNGYFADGGQTNSGGKPWKNGDSTAMTEFWEGRDQWLPTWDTDSSFYIDYVKVWAL